MEHAKVGQNSTTGDLRRRILLPAMRGYAYDIHVAHFCFSSESNIGTEEEAGVALSVRYVDQVDDTTDVDLATQASDPGIFARAALNVSIAGASGGMAIMGAHTVPFPRPYRVPYLAVVIHQQFGVSVQVSAEVFYDVVRVSQLEQAQLISEAGGRARTQ